MFVRRGTNTWSSLQGTVYQSHKSSATIYPSNDGSPCHSHSGKEWWGCYRLPLTGLLLQPITHTYDLSTLIWIQITMTDMTGNPSSSNRIHLLHWYIKGRKAHLPTLSLTLAEGRVDVVILKETLLRSLSSTIYHLLIWSDHLILLRVTDLI